MREQGSDDDPVLIAALGRLNKTYEEKFGFRFVVFVNQRPRSEVLHVLRERLQNRRDDELATGLDELVAIALDRWLTR
jgi:2-oxo-4-hydroxy-4-carboxy--5-ureidoimidazoline (OHCU) decarboxylase